MRRLATQPRLLIRAVIALITALSLLVPQAYSTGCRCASCCVAPPPESEVQAAAPGESCCCCCKPATAPPSASVQARCGCGLPDLQWSQLSGCPSAEGKTRHASTDVIFPAAPVTL